MISCRNMFCILGFLSGSCLTTGIALAKKDKHKVVNNYYGNQPGFTGYAPVNQPGTQYPTQGYPSQGYPSQGYPSQGHQPYDRGMSSSQQYHSDYQVPMKEKYGKTHKGKMSESNRYELTEEVRLSQQGITQSRYEDIVRDPQIARNDRERLAGLSAREVFILVDMSGSMSIKDKNPINNISNGYSSWTRWDSAKVAAQSVIELALCLDTDNQVEVILWDLQSRGLRTVNQSITDTHELDALFSKNKPGGSTPLYEVLEDTYQKWLRNLLQKSEPFTVVILTDGEPNEIEPVKQFFKKVIRENNLEYAGRETLAAFSFVRMGDDPGAKKFLQDLDDNLIRQLGVKVDIVDTKSDNFLFGTEEYYGRSGVGPFAMFWDALYD